MLWQRQRGENGARRCVKPTIFFDTADARLNQSKHTLRLREEGESFLLTAKGPERKSADGTLSEKSEEETAIKAEDARAALDGEISPLDLLERRVGGQSELLKALRSKVADEALIYVGSFTNTRTPVSVTLDVGTREHQVVFEMDRTEFQNGRVDCEVEIEMTGDVDREAASEALSSLLQRAGVERRSVPSKAKRFFDIKFAKTNK